MCFGAILLIKNAISYFCFWTYQYCRVSHSSRRGVGRSPPPLFYDFFRKPPPPKPMPPGVLPPLKNEAPPIWKTTPPPLKHKPPFHEIIPRKSTINNKLKSSSNPWKVCLKKFIFSKSGGLQAYSQQLYHQMNFFTGIFRQHFKLPLPHQILRSPPQWWGPQPPMFETSVGNPVLRSNIMQVVFIYECTYCGNSNQMLFNVMFFIFKNKRQTGYDINIAK